MATQNSEQDPLLQAIEDEAKRLGEDALFCYAGHNQEARTWDRMHRMLGIPTTLLAAAAGVTSFSSSGSLAASLVAGGLSFGVAAIAGLNTFLDPKGRAMENYRAANAYAAIRNEARYLYCVECKKDKTGRGSGCVARRSS